MSQPEASQMPKPLEGITVLDLTTALAGPFATLLLGGLGARVIKIENPLNPDSCRDNAPFLGPDGVTLGRTSAQDISVSALNRLRNKESITLNLKKPEAREIFADLVQQADAVVDNFSRGTLDKLGIGYGFGSQLNPRVVYCSINGFGSDGDMGGGKAMDAIIQALSGVMMTSGAMHDPPVRVGIPFADLCAPLFGVIGLLAALFQARSTGLGQQVDVSMLGVMSSLVACEPFDLLERCGVPQRTGLTVPRLAPFGIYPTSDGYIAICAPTEAMAASLFRAMGKEELLNDVRFRTRDDRVRHVAELDALIETFTRSHETATAIRVLEQFAVPAAPVRTPLEAVRDPRVVARGETVRLTHPSLGDSADVFGMGLPIRFSGSSSGFDSPAPALGEHNAHVYCDCLGYTTEKLQSLHELGVI